MLAVIGRLVRDGALAQDLLQECLLKIWLRIARYAATRGCLFTGMVRVCCNQAIDAMRSPRQRKVSTCCTSVAARRWKRPRNSAFPWPRSKCAPGLSCTCLSTSGTTRRVAPDYLLNARLLVFLRLQMPKHPGDG